MKDHPTADQSVRVRVRVPAVSYVLDTGLTREEWLAMPAEDRECLVYDATEELCKFETLYEEIPCQTR